MAEPSPIADSTVLPPIAGLRQVLVCGPVAEPGKPARGGFESANLRVVTLARRLSAESGALRYPESEGGAVAKAIAYLAAFARIGLAIALGDARGALIHFTPLSKHFMPWECALIALARLKGFRVVFDIRAGSQRRLYLSGGPVNRATFRRALRLAHVVAYEGRPYEPFLDEVVPGKPRFWLPNMIPASELKPRAGFDADGPRLVYVGLVSEAKGAVAAVKLARELRTRLPGTKLTFIGRRDPAVAPLLAQAGGDAPWIEFTGPLPPTEVYARLDRAHYFVFLSLWRGEGHSNALTEAMARGCVPIVTRHGFSADVVADCGFVVEDRERLEAAADWMVANWNAADWTASSRATTDRVAANFTDRQALRNLHEVYRAALA
jgi:glycosyltransferase involved in cell wall biosynthesis